MLVPKNNNNSQLENLFSPRSPIDFLGFAVVGVIINLLSGGEPLGFVGVAVLFLYWFWVDYRRAKKLSKQLGLSVDSKEPAKGAKGLILLLSPYSPRQASLKDETQLKPLVEYILTTPVEKLQLADFEAIDLFNSNLLPQIKAVEYHVKEGKLRDVWLISSKSYDSVKGSEITTQILSQYLIFEYGQRLEVNTQGYCVEDWNYKKLWQIADNIFRESDYKDEALIADITGGTKMMSVALAMACALPKRRMQYMDAQRDWQGHPLSIGEIKPIGIDIAPIIHGNNN